MKTKVALIISLTEHLKHYTKSDLDILCGGVRSKVLDKAFPDRDWNYGGSHLKLDPVGEDEDGNYTLLYSTWDVSYHNGDIYNYRKHYAILTMEVVDLILENLEEHYMEKETVRLVEENRKEIRDMCRGKVVPALQRFVN